MIDQFNEDPNVYIFLISTLAGGTGLNLTGNTSDIFCPHDADMVWQEQIGLLFSVRFIVLLSQLTIV